MADATDKLQAGEEAPRVLVVYFSFSGQTSGILTHLAAGLKEQGVVVETEKLQPVTPLRFPIGNVPATLAMMLITFFRNRVPIQPLSELARSRYDCIILAGPTWSYNPSGPVLSLIDRDGKALFAGQTVVPLISCRGYWRMHWYGLRHLLGRCGATVPNCIVFSHPSTEPWRTLGVFLKLAGKNPELSKIIGRFYRRYGHSKEQRDEAWRFGLMLGDALRQGRDLAGLDFHTPTAVP